MANQQSNFCWICLDKDQETDFFHPCKCNFPVHKKCLEIWRNTKLNHRNYNCLSKKISFRIIKKTYCYYMFYIYIFFCIKFN